MTDENGGPEFFFGSPQELAAEMKRRQELSYMSHQDFEHSTLDLFESLNEGQLSTMKSIIANSHNTSYASYNMGIIDMIGRSKFGVCTCGSKHDEELANMANVEKPVSEFPEGTDAAHRDYLNLCETYFVKPKEDALGGVICLGCGTEYVTLDDRMLRHSGQEGCSVCVDKEKWG